MKLHEITKLDGRMAICNWVVYDCWLLTVICKLATNFQLGAQINVLTPLCLLLPRHVTAPPTVVKQWCFFPGVLHGAVFFSILLCISPFTNLCSFPSLSNHYKNAHSTSTIEEMKLCFYPKVLAIHNIAVLELLVIKATCSPVLSLGSLLSVIIYLVLKH